MQMVAAQKKLSIVLGLVLSICTVAWFTTAGYRNPPSRERLERNLFKSPRLLAYYFWHSKPHVLFEEGNKIYFDHLRRDLINNPKYWWQWTGSWYYINVTSAPASLGFAPCTGYRGESCNDDLEIFGQINDLTITTLSLKLSGEWRNYPVSYPGFAVRLESIREVPPDYRWLDAKGSIIWTANQDSTLTGPSDARYPTKY